MSSSSFNQYSENGVEVSSKCRKFLIGGHVQRITSRYLDFRSVVACVAIAARVHRELDFRLVGIAIIPFATRVTNREIKDFRVLFVIEHTEPVHLRKWLSVHPARSEWRILMERE